MWLQGCGFAYRYTCLPHVAKAKNKPQDFGISSTRSTNGGSEFVHNCYCLCINVVKDLDLILSVRFNGHFPGEPGLADVY